MRWTATRKVALIEKVRMAPYKIREQVLAEVLSEHSITSDEWQTWLDRFDNAGKAGLKATVRAGVPS